MISFFRNLSKNIKIEKDAEPPYKLLDSTLILSTRYDLDTSRLYIRFRNGSEYVYCRVTPYAYNAFLNAESFSDHFHSFISLRYLNYQVM